MLGLGGGLTLKLSLSLAFAPCVVLIYSGILLSLCVSLHRLKKNAFLYNTSLMQS